MITSKYRVIGGVFFIMLCVKCYFSNFSDVLISRPDNIREFAAGGSIYHIYLVYFLHSFKDHVRTFSLSSSLESN